MLKPRKTEGKWRIIVPSFCVTNLRAAQAKRHFTDVLRYTQIFCHAYISLYRFLHTFWYITMSNYASIKNNWYKSYVTIATNAIGRVCVVMSRQRRPISCSKNSWCNAKSYKMYFYVTNKDLPILWQYWNLLKRRGFFSYQGNFGVKTNTHWTVGMQEIILKLLEIILKLL